MSLREGFSTGTAAAAATKAALTLLLTGRCPAEVDVPRPPGHDGPPLAIAIESCVLEAGGARAKVIKDGGDDPDVTHGAAIEAFVTLGGDDLVIRGGRGVGKVTRPGLPVAVGEWAINPAPLEQIKASVLEILGGQGTAVTIEVPDGEVLARKTLNPRLGIVGGISILGTRGTVRPFSNQAWQATIASGLDVAKAAGLTRAGMSTGGRSERLLMARYSGWPDTAFIQAADHFAFAMRAAAERGFSHVAWGVFFGKLVKQAQGLADTHARSADMDFSLLAERVRGAGLGSELATQAARANTAMQVLELVDGHPGAEVLYQGLLADAARHAVDFAGGRLTVAHHLFAFDGRLLATYGPCP